MATTGVAIAMMGGPAFAISRGGTDSGNTLAATTDKTTSTPTATPTTTPEVTDEKGRTTRISTYKKDLKETLTDAVKIRIAARCEGAQGIVKAKTTNNGTVSTARAAAYADIVKNLQSLSTTLSADGSDVTTLNANISVLQTDITAFNTANTTYQQALADVAALDCKTDPTAFKAALEAARTDQKAVFKAAQTIRIYLTDTVKVTLKALKDTASTDKKAGV